MLNVQSFLFSKFNLRRLGVLDVSSPTCQPRLNKAKAQLQRLNSVGEEKETLASSEHLNCNNSISRETSIDVADSLGFKISRLIPAFSRSRKQFLFVPNSVIQNPISETNTTHAKKI